MKQVNEKNNDLNDMGVSPLQAEKGEWIMTPDGSLVQSAATKKHSQMKDNDVTDKLPVGSYIFSNDKNMTLYKKDFKGMAIGEELVHYEEGMKPKAPKDVYFDNVFKSKKKATPAELAKNIAKEYPVMAAREHNYNPFIKRANKLNKEARSKHLMILKGLNDMKKAELEQPIQLGLPQPIEQFQTGGEVIGGITSGAAAGAGLGPIGAGVGAIIGGVGSWLTGRSKSKEAERREKERAAFLDRIKQFNDQGYFGANAATFAKAAQPLPEYAYLDLSDPRRRTINTFGRIGMSKNARRLAAVNQAYAPMNSVTRNLQGSGLTPTQISNIANNAIGQGINSANQANLKYDDYFDRMRLNELNALNNLDTMEAQDRQRGLNTTRDRRYNRNMNVVGEFGNNFQNYNRARIQTEGLDMQTKLNLAAANAQERAQAIGAFNNTLVGAGSGIAGGLDAFQMRKANKAYMDQLTGGMPGQSNMSVADIGSVTGNQLNSGWANVQTPGVTNTSGLYNPGIGLNNSAFGMDTSFSLGMSDMANNPMNIVTLADGYTYYRSPSTGQWVRLQ